MTIAVSKRCALVRNNTPSAKSIGITHMSGPGSLGDAVTPPRKTRYVSPLMGGYEDRLVVRELAVFEPILGAVVRAT